MGKILSMRVASKVAVARLHSGSLLVNLDLIIMVNVALWVINVL